MKKQNLITFFLLLFIQSCGSESSDDVITEPIEYQFQLSAKLENMCGYQKNFTQFEVLLQDEDWQLIEKYPANVDGQVSFTVAKEKINYTIVANTQQGEQDEGLDITSYHQVSTSTPASYIAQFDSLLDNSNCECLTQDVELQHRGFSTINTVSASFSYESWQRINDQKTYFTDAEVCRVVGDEWAMQSIAVRGLDTGDNAIGVASLLTDFISNEDGIWQSAAVEVADIVALPQNHVAFDMRQVFANGEHFYAEVNDASELPVFISHPYVSESQYYSMAGNVFESLSTIFGDSIFSSHHQIKSSLYDEAFGVTPESKQPNIDNASFSELGSDGSYDYSALSGYPFVEITFAYEADMAESDTLMPVTWTMYGPIEGMLPFSVEQSGVENIINSDTRIQTTDIKIIKSSMSNRYDDYIRYYQGNDDSYFSDDLHYFHLQLLM